MEEWKHDVIFVVNRVAIRNTQIHCVGRMLSSVIYTNPVCTSQETHCLLYKAQPVNAV
jgi:hypothetical protein